MIFGYLQKVSVRGSQALERRLGQKDGLFQAAQTRQAGVHRHARPDERAEDAVHWKRKRFGRKYKDKGEEVTFDEMCYRL
jgi:hypothetical protein